MQLSALDATAQAELVRRGDATPASLVEAAIARIERHDLELGAVVRPLFEHARSEAARPRPAGELPPFWGVPIVMKDLGSPVAGVPMASGVAVMKAIGYTPANDGYLTQRLRAAGFILVGKTNTSELGILPTAEPDCWPPSRNPYDRTRSTGGSSGGSAAAVAAGLVPIAHANDGGGSIRIPASCCGLFGLKPTRGRLSMGPDLGDVNGGLVNELAVTRSVRDAAAILDILAGAMPGDPYLAPPPARPYRDEVGAPPGTLRIGFATRHLDRDGRMVESAPAAVAAVADAAALLRSLGHQVEPAEIDALRDPDWVPQFMAIWAVGVASMLAQIESGLGRPVEPGDVEPATYAIGALGRCIGGAAYVNAWRWVQGATRRVARFWDDHDLWLTPTVTSAPPVLGTFRSPPDDPLGGLMAAADFAPFTAPFNATGQPAASIPLYRDAGLPIGVQLVGAYGREDLLIRVASQLEAARPFDHAATRT